MSLDSLNMAALALKPQNMAELADDRMACVCHRHRRKTHRHFHATGLCTCCTVASMSACDSMQAAITLTCMARNSLTLIFTCEKIIVTINRFIAFMIILSIITFNNKHIGYYALFDFYLDSLFTVNYNWLWQVSNREYLFLLSFFLDILSLIYEYLFHPF